MTTEIYLARAEVSYLRPVLERILNGVAKFKVRPQYLGLERPLEVPVYLQRFYDEEMYHHVLNCRNKLGQIGSSRKLRLNCFEVSTLGLAARVANKEIGTDAPRAACLVKLPQKLEKLRRRAKNRWVGRYGTEAYKDDSERWQHFLDWLRFDILAPRKPRRPRVTTSAIYREQREQLRAAAHTVTSIAANPKEVQHLADLARREVRRGRHPFTMRELLKDTRIAEQFMADFILKRNGPGVLKPEYLPKWARMSQLAKRFEATLKIEVQTPRLQLLLTNWVKREVDPGYYDDVCDDISYQLGFRDQHRIRLLINGTKHIIEACRPEYTYEQDDLRSYWSVWAVRWMLALQPDENKLFPIIRPAFDGAKAWWKKITPEACRRKLKEIVARYPREDPDSRRLHPFAA